jgi:uncharacterized membrane protein
MPNRFRKYFDAMCSLYAILFLFIQVYLLLLPLFLSAYFNGTYQSVLSINKYGEAQIEMIFWVVSFPFIIYGVWLNCRSAVSQFDRDTKDL